MRLLYGIVIIFAMILSGLYNQGRLFMLVFGGLFIASGGFHIYLYLTRGVLPESLISYAVLRGRKSALYMAIFFFLLFVLGYFIFAYGYVRSL